MTKLAATLMLMMMIQRGMPDASSCCSLWQTDTVGAALKPEDRAHQLCQARGL